MVNKLKKINPKYKKLFLLGLFLILFSLSWTPVVLGASSEIDEVRSAYRKYKKIEKLDLKVPTVVEVPFKEEFFLERSEFAVLDLETNSFKPSLFKRKASRTPISVAANPDDGRDRDMADNNSETYAEFRLRESERAQTRIELSSPEPVTSSALTVLLDDHVALPNTIRIRAETDGELKTVVAKREMTQNMIRFPETTSDRWVLGFDYSQPLRITELRLKQETKKIEKRGLRFLAQPDHAYKVYFDADRHTQLSFTEFPDLSGDEDVNRLAPVPTYDNSQYTIADIDGDGVADIHDNCVNLANPDQKDVNNNEKGDRCEDFDKDGIINSSDNCPDHPNPSQADEDGDGIGDACDSEESRFTERHKWIPWTGLGFAAFVLIVLFAITTKSLQEKEEDKEEDTSSELGQDSADPNDHKIDLEE